MRSNVLKVSALAATIAASFGAHAAVYKVHKYTPVDGAITYGVAVSPDSTDCWISSGTDCNANPDNFVIAAETKKMAEGFSFRDEMPFLWNLGFLNDDDQSEFESYCNVYLGYNNDLCSKWGYEQWSGYDYELNTAKDNSIAYVSPSNSPFNNITTNAVINSFDASGKVIGNRYNANDTVRNQAFDDTSLITLTNSSTQRSHAWAALDDTKRYIVGSLSTQIASNDEYSSKATVWEDGTAFSANWEFSDQNNVKNGDEIAQGSMRDIALHNAKRYSVGYNADAEYRPVASVFDISDPNNITTNYIDRFKSDDYLNSVLHVVNRNGIAVGTVKYAISNQNSFSNSLFYLNDISNPDSSYADFSGSIFFAGANGQAGGLNDKNEFVGQIDFERHNESNNGKPRAKRAFATVIGDTQYSRAAFRNGAYYLDDLTYGLESNNAYRIFDATDINDASVISGSAYYCEGGYDSYAIDATCKGGAPGEEQVVAVKLIPIQGATPADIQSRPQEEVTVERQGASLGWLALGLLGLLGFRRK